MMAEKHPNMKFYKTWRALFNLDRFFYQNSTELSTGIKKIRIFRIPVYIKRPSDDDVPVGKNKLIANGRHASVKLFGIKVQ